jgi:hypothetical protein
MAVITALLKKEIHSCEQEAVSTDTYETFYTSHKLEGLNLRVFISNDSTCREAGRQCDQLCHNKLAQLVNSSGVLSLEERIVRNIG